MNHEYLMMNDLDYKFANPNILRMALTHKSAARGRLSCGNERLEFLGDRVLGLVIAEMLYKRFSDECEGSMAKRFVALVRRETLSKLASNIKLDCHIILAKGEKAAGAETNPSILADCMEAVIAALYLDGGLAPTQRFITKLWSPLFDELEKPPQDPKTQLQEWLQKRGQSLPQYKIIEQQGPAHAPIFTIALSTSDGKTLKAEGRSKREAEQLAAKSLLKILSNTKL